jgi:hypothetical protein
MMTRGGLGLFKAWPGLMGRYRPLGISLIISHGGGLIPEIWAWAQINKMNSAAS